MHDRQLRHLIMEFCEMSALDDAAWADYQRDGNKQAWAIKQARLFRAIFVPSLASALTRTGDPEAFHAFADRLEDGRKRRLASHRDHCTRSSRRSFSPSGFLVSRHE
jgi:hypothetical protein